MLSLFIWEIFILKLSFYKWVLQLLLIFPSDWNNFFRSYTHVPGYYGMNRCYLNWTSLQMASMSSEIWMLTWVGYTTFLSNLVYHLILFTFFLVRYNYSFLGLTKNVGLYSPKRFFSSWKLDRNVSNSILCWAFFLWKNLLEFLFQSFHVKKPCSEAEN